MSKRNGHERKAARRAERQARQDRRASDPAESLRDSLAALPAGVAADPERAAEFTAAATRLREIILRLPPGERTSQRIAALPASEHAEVVRLAERVAELGGPALFVREGNGSMPGCGPSA